MGTRGLFGSDGNVLHLDHGDGCRLCKFTKSHWIVHLTYLNYTPKRCLKGFYQRTIWSGPILQMRKLRVRTKSCAHINPDSKLSSMALCYHSVSPLYLQCGWSQNDCKGVGELTLQMRTLKLVWRITQDTSPPTSRKLYSLFTEPAKLVQDLVDDALMVILQVCLQHSGQCMFLHPHLNPRTEGQGSMQVHFIHHCFIGPYLLLLIFKKPILPWFN